RPWFLYSSWRSSDAEVIRDELSGFRVARTIPMAEEAVACPPRNHPGNATRRVVRSSIYTLNAWFHQTGVRRIRPANEPHGGTGFRVARTQPP
ncbi:MAG TPA: hypothetical protein PK867_30950, partial [Pirellulales bacterium]|nr:hypothetical protein [Pirellulales bacterium]